MKAGEKDAEDGSPEDVRPDGLPILMTTAEVAEMLQVDASTPCRWRQAGVGPGRPLTRSMPRYQRRDVMVDRADGVMTIRKEPSGRFRAVLKVGRVRRRSHVRDKREAQAWLARERAAIAGGVDPRAGRATVRSLLPVWLEERRHSVSAKTYDLGCGAGAAGPTRWRRCRSTS